MEWMGYIAGFFTTIAFLPQVWRILRSKHTKDLSLSMYALYNLGVACWLSYGILLKSWPMIVANGITLVLSLIVLAMKFYYG